MIHQNPKSDLTKSSTKAVCQYVNVNSFSAEKYKKHINSPNFAPLGALEIQYQQPLMKKDPVLKMKTSHQIEKFILYTYRRALERTKTKTTHTYSERIGFQSKVDF